MSPATVGKQLRDAQIFEIWNRYAADASLELGAPDVEFPADELSRAVPSLRTRPRLSLRGWRGGTQPPVRQQIDDQRLETSVRSRTRRSGQTEKKFPASEQGAIREGNRFANDVEEYTTLDAPELNGKPDALVYVTHNWNPGGVGGTYFDHAVGVYYQSGHWYVRNQDLATMPAGIDFNIVVASLGSTNAFRATLDAVAAPALRLEHPQLDDNPCAALLVTRNAATSADANNVPYGLRYVDGVGGASGHWWIVAEGPGGPSFPGGSGFNVMVQGAQAGMCRNDRIFADGFDAP